MLFDLNDRDKAILELLADRSFISVLRTGECPRCFRVTIRGDPLPLSKSAAISSEPGAALYPQCTEHPRAPEAAHGRKTAHRKESGGARLRWRPDLDRGRHHDCTLIEVPRRETGCADSDQFHACLFILPHESVHKTGSSGGTFRRETESQVGPIAVLSLDSFNARLAFVGTDGFSIQRGMTTQLTEGA